MNIRYAAAVFILSVVVSGCSINIERSPAPEDQAVVSAPYGIRGEYRIWGDYLDRDVAANLTETIARRRYESFSSAKSAETSFSETILTLSGGGADGAFGAGLLNGWSARGDRPEFTVVTGISTGAIIAVFAFLGEDYDDELKEVYTTYSTDDLLQPKVVAAILGADSVTDASGYRSLIERYIDDEVVEQLAEEHRKGRTLLIGTTNLDANRPVTWSIGAIASLDHPDRKKLIWDVIQASSAIPAVFPSVLIPVVGVDGRDFDELHVDGGTVNQVIYINPAISLKDIDDDMGIEVSRKIYVVINSKTRPKYDPVTPSLLSVASSSASTIIGGAGKGDLYRILTIAERDEIDMKVVSIGEDFQLQAQEPFDSIYMQGLYDYGYEVGVNGPDWKSKPEELKQRRHSYD